MESMQNKYTQTQSEEQASGEQQKRKTAEHKSNCKTTMELIYENCAHKSSIVIEVCRETINKAY